MRVMVSVLQKVPRITRTAEDTRILSFGQFYFSNLVRLWQLLLVLPNTLTFVLCLPIIGRALNPTGKPGGAGEPREGVNPAGRCCTRS